MSDKNERKRDKNDDDKKVGSGVGAVPGDTIATALDPFGSAAGAISVEDQDSQSIEDTDKDNNLSSNE